MLVLTVFAALVSTVFAVILRHDTRSRVRYGLIAFALFVLSALAAGWLMYPFPD